MTPRAKVATAVGATAALAGGAALYLTTAGPAPVTVSQVPPHARYRACWNPPPEAAYKWEVREAYAGPGGFGLDPALWWDPVRIRIDCPSSPCCVDLEEYRPAPAPAQVWLVANSYTADSQPIVVVPTLIDLGTVGSYPGSTTTSTSSTTTSTSTSEATSTTTGVTTTTTEGGCL